MKSTSTPIGPRSARMSYPGDRVVRFVLLRNPIQLSAEAAPNGRRAVEDEPFGLVRPLAGEARKQPIREPLVDGGIIARVRRDEVEAVACFEAPPAPVGKSSLKICFGRECPSGGCPLAR